MRYIKSNTIGYNNPVEHLKYDIQRDFLLLNSEDYLQLFAMNLY
ncbi:hypothetical protein BBKW_0520 [Bifidobacterium catenulatum subsp. kashiwanohense JCM 15439 = DSM 21854]|nr:hypothetical protein BBKW_0520 [Bifidobacterium catenulatum subsp. kashiwanohense JCM 15439 = DSM 21854]